MGRWRQEEKVNVIKGAVVLAALFLVVVFLNCTMIETMYANSVHPPPSVMQWEAGKECSCGVLRYYAEFFITSAVSDSTDATMAAVQ